MNCDKQLTLLLTLKDRPVYTKRWLAYADQFHCPFPILIADGSKTSENADIIKNYLSKLDIQYCRYPLDENFAAYYRKVADAATKIKTPYVLQVNNDDLYDFSTLSQGVHLLEKNNIYHSCHIKSLTFSIKKPFFISSCSNANKIDVNPRAHERLLQYFSGAPGAYYNIHRHDFYEKFWKDIVHLNFLDIRSHEIMLDTLSYASGNVGVTPSYGYFREESGQGNTCQVETNMLKEIMQPFWVSEQITISEYVADLISRQDGLQKEIAVEYYFNGLRNFLATPIVRDLLTQRTLSNKNRKKIYQLIAKDVISNSMLNKPIRKIVEAKNRIHKKETEFLPICAFLESWYDKKLSAQQYD